MQLAVDLQCMHAYRQITSYNAIKGILINIVVFHFLTYQDCEAPVACNASQKTLLVPDVVQTVFSEHTLKTGSGCSLVYAGSLGDTTQPSVERWPPRCFSHMMTVFKPTKSSPKSPGIRLQRLRLCPLTSDNYTSISPRSVYSQITRRKSPRMPTH